MTTIKTQEHWEEKHIANFWDWISQSEYWQSKYFTKQVGSGLVKFFKSKANVKGKYLDYGCGSGHLLELMLQSNSSIECYGLEYSPKSRALVNNKLSSYKGWNECKQLEGFPSAYEENSFDFITFIETIEHLKDEMLNNTLNELQRLLKPGGQLVVTTPYDEQLTDSHVYCPFCDSEFHKMQHMRSFTVPGMVGLMAKHGLDEVYCDHVNFMNYGPWKQRRVYLIRQFLQAIGLKKYPKQNRPHLVGIFTKK